MVMADRLGPNYGRPFRAKISKITVDHLEPNFS